MAKTVDTRGLSCPQPVIMVKEAVAGGNKEIDVLVDNPTPLQNITRFATKANYAISVEEKGDEYVMHLTAK